MLVEDNPADVHLLHLALDESGVPAELQTFSDGDSAVAFLKLETTSPPDLLLVDLNLPKVSGQSVIMAARSSERHAHVPVIVLTTSRSPRDRQEAERAGATAVINKPNDYDEFCRAIRELIQTHTHRAHGKRA